MSKIARHTPVLSGENKIRALSIDSALFPHVGDAITALTKDWHWEPVGDDVADIVAACKLSVESWYSDMLIGTVFPWIINPPAGWLLLDGSTYASADYPELSALLPDHLISGPDFTLPNVENAFPFGVLDKDVGTVVTGSNVLNLTTGQLPSHTHTEIPPTVGATVGGAGPPLPSAEVGSPIASGSTGDGDDIDTRPKRFGLVYAVFVGRE
jgi:microcystin-dependent protein